MLQLDTAGSCLAQAASGSWSSRSKTLNQHEQGLLWRFRGTYKQSHKSNCLTYHLLRGLRWLRIRSAVLLGVRRTLNL